MKIIYDEVYPEEFFRYGGKVFVGSFNFEVDTYGKWKDTVSSTAWTYDYINDCGGDAWIGDMHFTYDEENGWFKYKDSFPKVDHNDPYGIPNVNFSLIDNQDSRWEEYTKQRKERGFDNSELWNLNVTIAKFILPRIEAYKETCIAHPGSLTEDKWNTILCKMISAFKIYLYDSDLTNDEKVIKKFCQCGIIKLDECSALEKHKEYVEGMELFYKWWKWLGD